MSEKFYVVAAIAELDASPQMHVDLNGEEILLVRDGEDFYAIAYYCSHEEFTLEGGMVNKKCITCPYHGAEFSLVDGHVLSPPAYEDIKTYPVKVNRDEGTLAVGVSD